MAGYQELMKRRIAIGCRAPCHQWVRNTLLKQGYTTTKKREKHLFDVDNLVNVLVSLWTEDDSVFIHESMRDQITFLLLAYFFSGIGAFLHIRAGVTLAPRLCGPVVFYRFRRGCIPVSTLAAPPPALKSFPPVNCVKQPRPPSAQITPA
jgi:hypothetical protein